MKKNLFLLLAAPLLLTSCIPSLQPFDDGNEQGGQQETGGNTDEGGGNRRGGPGRRVQYGGADVSRHYGEV